MSFLFFFTISLTSTSQELLFGFKLEEIITADAVLPIVKVNYHVMSRTANGEMTPWRLTLETRAEYRKLIHASINKEGIERPIWKLRVNGRYGLFTYRGMSTKERKSRNLEKGTYLMALSVTEDIFQDEDFKQEIRNAEDATSLDSLLSQNVEEISATLEEMGGMDSIIQKMCIQEHGLLQVSGDEILFYPVTRKL